MVKRKLNLNGKTITFSNTSSILDTIAIYGKLTLIDDSNTEVTNQGWIINNSTSSYSYALAVYDGGSLTVNAGNYLAKGAGAIYVSNGTVSVTKGCLMGNYGICLSSNANALVTDLNCTISDEVDADGDLVSNGFLENCMALVSMRYLSRPSVFTTF